MPEPLIQAMNNPVTNVEAVQPTPTPQVNPVTIPIQIQPQIAQPVQPTQNQTQPNNDLQVEQSVAPTPQTYNQNANRNNNYVDFNQIYKGYQSQYGINPTNNVSNSGVKKTSIGTSIVTPKVTNLNSVQGQYQSAYADTINSLISEMLTQSVNGFEYDPTNDNALKVATEYAANSTLQSLAGSGVLNSSATAERVARIVSSLIPEYEKLAYTRWTDYLGRLADTANLVMNYDSQQFQYWKDAKDREFEEKEFEYKKAQDELENTWKRVDELGYVDNKASAILGVATGTLSGQARLAKEEQEFQLRKMREQAQIEYANQKALYELRSELDKEYKAYEYELSNKYGSSSSSSSSKDTISSYQKLINNRWGEKDLIDNDKYTVTDNDAAWNYLTNQYAIGNLDDNAYGYLVAYYGLTTPSNTATSTSRTNRMSENASTGGKSSFGYGSGGGFR